MRPALFIPAILALLVPGCTNESPKQKTQSTFFSSASPAAPEDYQQHIAALKPKIKRLKEEFHVVIEPPFVVIGNGEEKHVKHDAEKIVRWTVQKLKQDFFKEDPKRILDIWLFNSADTYEAYVYALTGKKPTTPYGFYSRENGALYMNIRTGGGTLVHEIVHPYVEANFPNAPPWLNEGLGSLYEQSDERGGHIIGNTNWRLRGLKAAISDARVPPFSTLTSLNDYAFYGENSDVHYAASRYLLYYLQERGLLLRFYHSFYENRESDPTGYQTLVRTLGETDMASFETRWTEFVMGLSFP